jgi:hypothetical protein
VTGLFILVLKKQQQKTCYQVVTGFLISNIYAQILSINIMEEERGFEPLRGLTRLSVFKTDPFSRTWVFLRIDKKYFIIY